jgi:hypothetical protein
LLPLIANLLFITGKYSLIIFTMGQQIFMGTLVDNPALFKDQDTISPTDLAQPVGDQEGRPLAADPAHCFLDLVLSGAVDGARTVI